MSGLIAVWVILWTIVFGLQFSRQHAVSPGNMRGGLCPGSPGLMAAIIPIGPDHRSVCGCVRSHEKEKGGSYAR